MSQDDTTPPTRRIIVPQKAPQAKASALSIVPDAATLLDDALSVVATEVIKFKRKSMDPMKALDLSEARVLQGYIKSLVELCKEQREREEAMDLANKSDEEIVALVEKLRAMRKAGELP
jgi:hypothetical protein